MAPNAHSAFPASASARLLACPGSFALGNAISDGARRSTVYSAEGTLAHSVAEASLLAGLTPEFVAGRKFQADGFEFIPEDEFVDAVQVYVNYVNNLKALGYLVALEVQVSPQIHWQGLPDLGIELFGTSDCLAYHPVQQDLVVADLKFGRGVSVEARDNVQFRYYGAGAINPDFVNALLRAAHGPNFTPVPKDWRPSRLKTVVVQPRAYHPEGPIRSAEYTADEIIEWARTTLYEGVKRAQADDGKTLVPGEHCRFCPALAHCPAYVEYMAEAAQRAFAAVPLDTLAVSELSYQHNKTNTEASQPADDPTRDLLPDVTLSDATLGEIMDKIAVLKPYFTAIEELARERDRAQPGSIPGWKAVPGRARRVWGDEDESVVRAQLAQAGLAESDFTENRLLSPAQVQRRVGAKAYARLVAQFVGHKSSAPTLAPDADPRTRLLAGRTAEEAFASAAPKQLPKPD